MKSLRQWLTATRLLGRDAVVTVSLVVSGLIAVLPVFGWSGERAALVSAALVAVGGVVSAWLVAVDRALPLLVGLGKAVVAAVAGFGVHLPDNQVAALMAVLTLVGGLATRTQVGAVQPARDSEGLLLGPFDPLPTARESGSSSVEHFSHPAAPPLPSRPEDPPTVTWSAQEPMTDYLPHVGPGEVNKHRPTEDRGRHHARWWPDGGCRPAELG